MQNEAFLRVTVISGLPGAGKSVVARALRGTDRPAGHVADQSAVELVVEAPPAVSPFDTADFLAAESELRHGDAREAYLGDLVSVIDASRFWSNLYDDAAVPGETDASRTVADALVEQIEWASVVVINKVDLVPRAVRGDIRDFVRLLNPSTFIVFSEQGEGAADSWPAPRPNILEWLGRSPGWVRQLNGDALLSQSPQGLSCVVYRDVRPFHPGRLAAFFAEHSRESGDILRSRGLFRLASRPGVVGSWSSVGDTVTLEPTQMLSHDPESPWGQEIAFFGRNLEVNRLTQNLNACLLSDTEFLSGPVQWCAATDPFPEWDLQHRH